MASNRDPLALADLDPDAIQARIDLRDKKAPKPPSELEMNKEARLAEKEKRLSTGIAKKAPSDAPPTAPPPPIVNRSMLLDKITAYRERFPQLKKRNNVNAKCTIEEL